MGEIIGLMCTSSVSETVPTQSCRNYSNVARSWGAYIKRQLSRQRRYCQRELRYAVIDFSCMLFQVRRKTTCESRLSTTWLS